jgi:hypothetical protein
MVLKDGNQILLDCLCENESSSIRTIQFVIVIKASVDVVEPLGGADVDHFLAHFLDR